MSETSNLAHIARLVFDKIFPEFGWRAVGTPDRNWTCALPDEHDKKTHPSDIVCRYDDPYVGQVIFVGTDLKSYAAAGINVDMLSTSMRSLALATQCMNLSADFQSSVGAGETNFEAVGLLFVYNHDHLFEAGKFGALVDLVPDHSRRMAEGRRMFLVGPADVLYLYAIAKDLREIHGQYFCGHDFFYPDVILKRARATFAPAASIEMLTGPWQIARLTGVPKERAEAAAHYIFYYRNRGSTIDEFAYVIDFLFRFQLIKDDARIDLRLACAADNAAEVWKHAVDFYADRYAQLGPEAVAAIHRRIAQHVHFGTVDRAAPAITAIEAGNLR